MSTGLSWVSVIQRAIDKRIADGSKLRNGALERAMIYLESNPGLGVHAACDGLKDILDAHEIKNTDSPWYRSVA